MIDKDELEFQLAGRGTLLLHQSECRIQEGAVEALGMVKRPYCAVYRGSISAERRFRGIALSK